MIYRTDCRRHYAENPLHTFLRNFPVDCEAANLLRICCGLVSDTANKSATSRFNPFVHIVPKMDTYFDGKSWNNLGTNGLMEFGKRHDTTDFCPRQLVTDLTLGQNPLHTFPRNVPVDGEAGNGHLLRTCRLCCGLVVDLLRGKLCNGVWPLQNW